MSRYQLFHYRLFLLLLLLFFFLLHGQRWAGLLVSDKFCHKQYTVEVAQYNPFFRWITYSEMLRNILFCKFTLYIDSWIPFKCSRIVDSWTLCISESWLNIWDESSSSNVFIGWFDYQDAFCLLSQNIWLSIV